MVIPTHLPHLCPPSPSPSAITDISGYPWKILFQQYLCEQIFACPPVHRKCIKEACQLVWAVFGHVMNTVLQDLPSSRWEQVMRKLGTWVTRPEGVEAFQEQGELGGEKLALPIYSHKPFSGFICTPLWSLSRNSFYQSLLRKLPYNSCNSINRVGKSGKLLGIDLSYLFKWGRGEGNCVLGIRLNTL